MSRGTTQLVLGPWQSGKSRSGTERSVKDGVPEQEVARIWASVATTSRT